MNEQSKNITPYSLEDIERYLQGKLSPAEMHELEKAAVQDPFLADAIEGYQATDLTLVKQDMADLHSQLSPGPAKVIPAAKQNGWWRVAAAIVLLAGTGILGLKLFNDKNNTQQLAKTATVVPLQKDTSYLASSIATQKAAALAVQKKEAAVAVQKNALLANNNRMQLSLKKSVIDDNLASLDIKSLQPVAALPVKPYPNSETMMAKDTALRDKTPVRDIVAANTVATRSSGLSASSNSSLDGNIYKSFDPALAAKKEKINTILANGSITIGAGIPVGKGKRIKGDTINLDRSEMPFLSQAGYLKTTDSAIIPLSNPSFTVARNVIAGKRSTIAIDTPVLTDQKKMYVTFNESKPPAASSTVNFQAADAATKKPATAAFNVGPQRLNSSLIKNDSAFVLPEVSVTGYGGITKKGVLGSTPSPDARKELSRSAAAAPANNAERRTVPDFSGSSYLAIPTNGWYDFTKYLADKIATKKNTGEHGSVEIKMNISESGKVSKVRILKSFNEQLNPILIKAIRKGPRWKSTDYLAKKDFIFKVDL